jgi:hypothetical protein
MKESSKEKVGPQQTKYSEYHDENHHAKIRKHL